MKWRVALNPDGTANRYAKRYGAWTVCRVTVLGVDRYECWHGRELVRWFPSAAEATSDVEREVRRKAAG